MEAATDIRSRALLALASRSVSELRDLEIQVRDGTLWIQGTVSSFYHKQMAQETLRSVCGEIEIVNSIRVGQGDDWILPEADGPAVEPRRPR